MLPALVYTVLVFAGVAALRVTFGIPVDSAGKAVAFLERYGFSLRLGSFFELGSAIPLGIFVATAVSRLRFLRIRAAGEMIALAGGIGAMGMLFVSSLAIWSLTRMGVPTTADSVRILQAIGFATGGPGFVAALGLFVAGVSVTAGLHRFIPRWLMWLGLFIALVCELATLTLVVWKAAFFIPAGRFSSILWMICIAATLPATIPAERARL